MAGLTDTLLGQIDVLTNIAKTLGPVQELIKVVAGVLGLGFIFKAIWSLKIYGESRTMTSGTANAKEPILYIIVGSVLLSLPTAIEVLLMSTFGESSAMPYAPINSSNDSITKIFGAGSAIGRPLTMIIQVIGLVAFIRGWVLIARSASQGQPPGGTGKGLMHVFGGILAINIVKTIEVINNTLYG